MVSYFNPVVRDFLWSSVPQGTTHIAFSFSKTEVWYFMFVENVAYFWYGRLVGWRKTNLHKKVTLQ